MSDLTPRGKRNSVWRWKVRQMGRLQEILSMSENITQAKGNECS